MDQIILCREKLANSVMLQITQVSYFVDFFAVTQLYMFNFCMTFVQREFLLTSVLLDKEHIDQCKTQVDPLGFYATESDG